TRTSVGPVFGAVVNVAGARPDQGGALSYREEHARVATTLVVDRALSGTLVNGALTLSATAGMRDAPDEQLGFGTLTATLGVGRAVALQASLGSYPSSRLTGTLGGHFANVGVVLQG